jgi:hypothetical protein
VLYHGGELMSLGEFGHPYLIDPQDLSTKGVFNYDGKLPGNMTDYLLAYALGESRHYGQEGGSLY